MYSYKILFPLQTNSGYKPLSESDTYIPSALLGQFQRLYYYQKETVNFLLDRFLTASDLVEGRGGSVEDVPEFQSFQRFRGALVGHSPGMGKTPVTCFTLSVLFQLKQVRYALVVVPKTLMEQWRTHLQTWCPNAYVALY